MARLIILKDNIIIGYTGNAAIFSFSPAGLYTNCSLWEPDERMSVIITELCTDLTINAGKTVIFRTLVRIIIEGIS